MVINNNSRPIPSIHDSKWVQELGLCQPPHVFRYHYGYSFSLIE